MSCRYRLRAANSVPGNFIVHHVLTNALRALMAGTQAEHIECQDVNACQLKLKAPCRLEAFGMRARETYAHIISEPARRADTHDGAPCAMIQKVATCCADMRGGAPYHQYQPPCARVGLRARPRRPEVHQLVQAACIRHAYGIQGSVL